MKREFAKITSVFLVFTMLFCMTFGSVAYALEPKNGWSDDGTMYYIDDVAVTGLNVIDDEYYLFNENGEKQLGWKNYNNARYYFEPASGKGLKGLNSVNGAYYLFGTNAKMKKGWQTYEGKKYRFSPTNGKAVTGLKKIGKCYYAFTKQGEVRYGWKNYNGGRFYFNTKTGKSIKGLKKIKGGYYYFGKTYRMKTGWQTVKGARYYFNPRRGENYGRAVTGKKRINGAIYYFRKNGKMITDEERMTNRAQHYTSPTSYLVLVNKSTHRVGIFKRVKKTKKNKKQWKMIHYYLCTIGAYSTPTPSGSFIMGPRGGKPYHQRYFDSGKIRCWYASRITGNYHFHSVLYTQASYPHTIAYGQLGYNMSHGCIRLDIRNARWIYNNIPAGTRCVIYS